MKRRDILKYSGYGMVAGVLSPLTSAGHTADVTSPLLNTRYGKVAGHREQGINVFKGVRYGADTSHYRFQAPQPPVPWSGVQRADHYGPASPQRNTQEPVSEDCLYLNIWTPGIRDHGQRPVLVYIHGGEYSTGSGSDALYDGIRLCQRGDAVVVTLNHRLNVFGHLYLDELAGGKYQCSGNAGLLDIVLALKWIRDHAEEIGGNPQRVTLFGQSGGGAKIACLMAMPAAQELFHHVMTMSGQQITVSGPHAATRRTRALMNTLHFARVDIQSLLNTSMEELIHATTAHDPSLEGRSLYFGPVLDDVVLQRHPFYPDAPSISQRIPMIIGNTHDETRFFYGKDDSLQALSWKTLHERLGDAMYVDIDVHKVINAYRQHYPQYTPSEVFFAASTAGRSWRSAIIEAELRAQQRAPAFVYQLNFKSPLDDGRWGACHTLDIPLVFNNIDKHGSKTGTDANAQKVSMTMCDALIHFARTGNPDHHGMPAWQPYSLPERNTMIFDVQSRMENDPRAFERKLFSQVPYIQRGTY